MPTLDRLACLAIGCEAAHLVLGVRHPDPALYRALAEARSGFLLAIDQPRLAVADLLETAHAEPIPAVRAVANSCALLMPYGGLPEALTLTGEAVRADPIGALLSVARHLGMETAAEEAHALLALLGAPPVERPVENTASAAGIPAGAGKIVGGALAGFEEHFGGTGLGRLVWNRDLFVAADPEMNIGQVLDLAGGTRTLIHGPYLHLPAGYWTASVHFGLSQEAAQFPLSIEISTDRQLAAVTVQPHAPGIHVADLGFSLAEPGMHAVVLRVNILDAAARGHFAFGHVVLTPAGLRHPEEGVEWQEEFRAIAAL